MADPLRLLFELDADPKKAIANFKRARIEFAQEIATVRKLASQPFQLPTIKSSPASVSARGVDSARAAALSDIRRIERERLQIVNQNTRAIEGLAKREADTKIREGRRAANALLATLRNLQREQQNIARRTSSSANTFLAGAAGGITALVGVTAANAIREAGSAWLDYSSKLQTTKIAFTQMLGSAQLAEDHLKELQQFALKTPFQFSELIDASQRMQALGFNAQQVIPVLNDVGNAVAAAGGGGERLDRVVLALSQIQSKGKVATQELNQLAEAGIPAFRILSQELGKSNAETRKLVEEGKVSSRVFLEAFQKFSQVNFGGLMEQQSKTFTGAMSNIKDALLQTSATAFEPLFEKLSQTAKAFADVATNSKDFQDKLKVAGSVSATIFDGIVAVILAFRDAIRLMFAAVSGQIKALIEIFKSLAHAIAAVTFQSLAFGAAIAGDLVKAAKLERIAQEELKLATDSAAKAFIAQGQVVRTLVDIYNEAEARTKALRDAQAKVGVDIGAGAGIFRRKSPAEQTFDGGAAAKGADTETRRRIRLLELEAQRAEAIARQRTDAENIRLEQRKTSLKEFTDFQIREEEIVLEKKRAVFAAERAEAEKLTKGRDLALGEIRLKELQAELDFATKRNQLFANQESEEVESARQHRQALLDIQDEGDKKQLELVDAYVERLLISYEEAETRRLEIEANARDRRRTELELPLDEAGQNIEEQQRIKDAIAKLDAESATAREEAENRKRAAIRATIEAENDYFQTLQDVTLRTAQLLRAAADIELGGLIRRFGDRRIFRLEQLRLEREANKQEHQERLRQIGEEQQDAEKRLEGVRDAEEKLLQLRRFYAEQEKAEIQRRTVERQEEEDEAQRASDPFDSLRQRFENFQFDIQNTNNSIAESLQSVSEQVNSVLGNMENALQQGIVAWILYGESLGKALQKALAQQLAVLSAEFAIQALKHAAYALGSLAFGNFASAAKHAAASAAFLAAAAATGVAARALSKSSGLYNQGKSTAASAVGGGATPQNREFQYGGQAVEPSSTASREGSAAPRTPGIFGAVVDLVQAVKRGQQENAALAARLDGTLSRIGSLPAGEVVTIGARDASLAIGAAVIQHQKENNDFSRDMATNMGIT